MASWRRAVFCGLLVWLIPFAAAVIAFPLKNAWRSLFESIMPVVLAAVVVALTLLYFRRAARPSTREGLILGFLWLAISVLIDLPLMVSPPINMPLHEYVADVGLTYLMIPIVTAGIAAAREQGGGGSAP